ALDLSSPAAWCARVVFPGGLVLSYRPQSRRRRSCSLLLLRFLSHAVLFFLSWCAPSSRRRHSCSLLPVFANKVASLAARLCQADVKRRIEEGEERRKLDEEERLYYCHDK
ncbi:hypothetical protein V2J09_000272, partial [Rumex salicifolius]